MTTFCLSLVLAVVALPVRADEAKPKAAAQPDAAPGAEAYRLLLEPLGLQGVEILSERGYVVSYGEKERRGLLHLQAAPLQALAQRGRSIQGLLAAYDKVRAGQAPEGSQDLHGLLKLRVSGLWTPALKSAAELLIAHLDNLASLGEQAQAAPKPLLFSTKWGGEFLSFTHADLLTDFRPLAPRYFAEVFAAPDRPAGAQDHFLAYVKAAYGKDASDALKRDLGSAQLSEELAGWLAKYLLDQKRLWSVSLTSGRLQALERSTSLAKDLRDLRAVADRLDGLGQALASIESVLARENAAPKIRFSAEKLHVYSEQGSPFDQGDSVLVTAAYWVEGGDPAQTVPVTEAGFIDGTASGVSQATSSSQRRKPGGPYVFTARVWLPLPGRKKYRFVLGAPDAEPLRLETDIDVSSRFPDFLQLAAHAESLASSCQLEEAVRGLTELGSALAPLAGKPQFQRLKASIEPRLKLLTRQEQAFKLLSESLTGVRLYAAKEQCDFRPDRAARALANLSELPAGCGRVAAPAAPDATAESARQPLALEIQGLLEMTQRRGQIHQAFRAAVDKARRAQADCRFKEAANLFAGALALLDSDPETRCGAAEKDYTQIRLTELPRARAGTAVSESLARSEAEGRRLYSAGSHAAALGVLTPLVARMDAMPDAKCYEGQRRKAQELALAAGASLAPPDPKAVQAALPQDPPGDEVKEVAAERGRLDKLEATRREKELRRQAPIAPAPRASSSPAMESPSTTAAAAQPSAAPAQTAALDPRSGDRGSGAAVSQSQTPAKSKKRKKKKSASSKPAPRAAFDSDQAIVIPKETQEKLNRSKALRTAAGQADAAQREAQESQ